MTIASGTRLGPYEILAPLGAGGMGEVYRARDTRLGRDVAVKVLPTSLAADVDRLHRFEQEACAAGALNHPNILVIHHIDTHEGAPYVVSELLEGEPLRRRIGGTALAPRRVIDYASQLAHGLAAAHEKGIVHRDLKPDNIFITKDGRVKILDFGLAKLTQPDDGQRQTEIPTRRVDTNPGVVMGTVGYMSPEQVRGQPVDHRSDIFSFGAILYEMLSGRRAFHGQSTADTMSAILKEDPPELSETNKTVSPALERLVNHCLEKNPEQRFHSARDLAFAIEALSGSSPTSAQTLAAIGTAPPRSLKSRELTAWIVAGVAVLAAAIAIAFPYFRRTTVETHAVRFTIPAPEKVSLTNFMALSPDGLTLAFTARDTSGKSLLWVRPLGSFDAKELPDTDGAAYPFWSPDSHFVAFFAQGKLKKTDISGGRPQIISDATVGIGGTWNSDNVIVFTPTTRDALYRVPADGGQLTAVTALDASHGETSHRLPYFLPDGRHFLFVSSNRRFENQLYVGSLDSKETKPLSAIHNEAAYAPPGYLIFRRDDRLMAQVFDATSLQLTGDPFPIGEQLIFITGPVGFTSFSVSNNGTLVYRTGTAAGSELIWFDRQGKQLGLLRAGERDINVALSPDGKWVAYAAGTGTRDIWLIDIGRGLPARFTFGPMYNWLPIWSPDGSRILFASNRDGPINLYQKPASGAAMEEALFKSNEDKFPTDWSADGQFILYDVIDPKTRGDLWILPLSGDRKPFPYLQTQFTERQAQFSPDGHWIAYSSDVSGQFEVYVQSFPNVGGPHRVSTNSGVQPRWRRDGTELFYISADLKLMAVDVKTGPSTFETGVPRQLFDTRLVAPEGRNIYAVTSDGQRFLINSGESPFGAQLNVVMNWTADLKR